MTIESIVAYIDIEQIKTFTGGLVVGATAVYGFLRTKFTNKELKEIAMSIHAARHEASDEGSRISNEEALDIIDDIVVAYID